MLVVVSPAKKLDMSPIDTEVTSVPLFSDEAHDLAKVASNLGKVGLISTMKISEKLADLNLERFKSFGHQDKKAAVFAFAGDTYQGFDATSLSSDGLRWAQDHLRILSGLYGILRPLDEIEPYRLEMGSKFNIGDKTSLHDFWKGRISEVLNQTAKETNSRFLVNCASQEYFGSVALNILSIKVITPIFYENTDNGIKIISFYAKKARGAMARYIMENRLSDPNSLLEFDLGGYKYQPEKSTLESPIFLRD